MKFLEAKDRALADILSRSRFRIDAFQREYRWQRKHIEALISDLATSFDKNYTYGDTISTYNNYDSYYMGPIVLCDDGKELSVVDGQQRLTSFTLLLIFLHHAQNNLLDQTLSIDLREHLYVKRGGKDTLILNVDSRKRAIEHLINNPNDIFRDIDDIENGEAQKNMHDRDESILNIIGRYEDITKLFPEHLMNEDRLPIFIEWLLHSVILVEIKAFSMESAYTIFETMNDRGLSLNPTEILKGYLLSMIDDDEKGEEMNVFWRDRIFEIKTQIGVDSDLDFFRNWLRSKYAETKRSTAKGSENLDFEQIGTQFNSWVKNNSSKMFLKRSDDFYYFIKSDFDFYSSVYVELFKRKGKVQERFENLYVTSFYTIADSLSYPLYLSPISKVDDEDAVARKIYIVDKFIDNYAVGRTFQGKSITQSSIRNYIYDLVKDIRNLEVEDLQYTLKNRLNEGWGDTPFFHMQQMNNWGFYHYFFARMLYHIRDSELDFQSLMRSKKQTSYVLIPIFTAEEIPKVLQDSLFYSYEYAVANFVLIRRYDLDAYNSLSIPDKSRFLLINGYLPEMQDYQNFDDILGLLAHRDRIITELVMQIWNF
ncbi:DUF262 domain-containing protein [Pedobacter sp. MC2016-05]|uniref:DUF262 domain-containing protein n=1 Tax=Pedobacter sp. MC2016-05 TaxID=2994474 RepID=UPI0022486AFA|nr:DUF262 domain-containing protein [Pedobacter sp. MC2016-05]MCX2476924.1 DUF262 domain-containing protein [Pedobacter sp. MC2016-05]